MRPPIRREGVKVTIPGMQPARDLEHAELRYAERMQQIDRPHGRQISRRSRCIALWATAAVGLLVVLAVILGWVGVLTGG